MRLAKAELFMRSSSMAQEQAIVIRPLQQMQKEQSLHTSSFEFTTAVTFQHPYAECGSILQPQCFKASV